MALPTGFIYLQDVDATIVQDMKYYSNDNFIGQRIDGYESPKCILTIEAANTLKKIQQQLKKQSLGLKVYDCYRPQTAVNHFIRWSQDASDQKMKLNFYPNVNKADFFKLGYVVEKSSHTRGSTVDLTLVRYNAAGENPVELDMGTHFDYMDELSHALSKNISKEAMANRLLLRSTMQEAGFEPYDTEWWHFTLKKEPFTNTYFDFPIK